MSIDFKNEEEVKEYLENIGIEYRYGCFSEKNPEACHLLGDYLDAIKKDYHKASKIYRTNCDDYNFPQSCHKFGTYAITGKGLDKKDEEVAFKYFLKACDLDVPNACLNAGIMSVSPDPKNNRERDYTKGIKLLDKSCTLKSNHACYYLSGLFITGSRDNQVQKDMKEAFKYSEKACDLGNIYACMNLSLMYRKGEGVEKNVEMADKVKKKVDELKQEIESSFTLEFERTSKS